MRVHVQSSRVYQSPLRVMPHSMRSVCSVAWRLREIFVFTPNGIFFFLRCRSQNNTLGSDPPAALRPPWRPSVPVPTRRLLYAFLTYLSRLRNIKERPQQFSPTACSVLLAHDADMACRDNRDSFAYDSVGERWSVYHAGGPTT